ncbi:hypothetical protein [Streptomyces sp. NPDC051572]|uniref:hypothetical protein n=1 Tax=Streptomyces sp. NPDC051572 TaxID=3155802 RepID=UPI00344BC2E9
MKLLRVRLVRRGLVLEQPDLAAAAVFEVEVEQLDGVVAPTVIRQTGAVNGTRCALTVHAPLSG